jgi:hypothetical protein
MSAGGAPAVQLQVIWQSSLPVKQAQVKRKYGSEAANAEEGKKYLAQEDKAYVISVQMPQMGRGMGAGTPSMKEALKESSSLNVKGKEPIKPSQVDVQGPMVMFVFPKATPITLDDKEVELVTKLGRDQIKCKFELKHMVIDGKLAL